MGLTTVHMMYDLPPPFPPSTECVVIITTTSFPGILMILQLLITGAPLQLNQFGILPLKYRIFSLLDAFLFIILLPVSSFNAEAHPQRKRACGMASWPWPRDGP